MKSSHRKALTQVETILIVAVIILGAGFAGLYLQFTKPVDTEPEPQPEPGPDTIKIGVPLALSGSMALLASQMADAAKLAAEEINARGGVLGKNVEIVLGDHEGKAELGAAVMERFIVRDEVVAIAGFFWSSVALSAMDVSHEYGIPLVIASAVSESITLKRIEFGYSDVFRVATHSKYIAYTSAAYLAEGLKIKSYATLYEEGNDYARVEAESIQQYMAENHPEIELTAAETVAPNTKDFYPVLTKIKAGNPNVIFSCPTGLGMPLLVKQVYELEMDTIVDGTMTFSFDEWIDLAGTDAAEYYSYNAFAWPDSYLDKNPLAKIFVTKWTAKYGSPPVPQHARMYDATYVICEAIDRAGTTEPAKIIAELEKGDFQVSRGIINFGSESGDWEQEPIHKAQIQDGQKVIVWPPEYAEAEIRIPPFLSNP